MDTRSRRGVKGSDGKRVSSASEDSLNDFKTPPSTRASKLADIRNTGFDGDNSPAVEVEAINKSFNNQPDENQPGPSNTKKPTKRGVSPPDDSLADFKSPKLESKTTTVKLLDKPKIKPKKTKRKTKKESNQMSIESSFFKPATSFACPLCLKTFPDSTSQLAHSKTCASKNNVSTRKLLEAVALQERQGEERRALGLPAQPFAQPRRKSTFKRSDLRAGDPDVQLALALSESLQEAQDLEELDAAIALAGDEVPMITSSQRRRTLRNFGFVTSKPAVEVTERPKRKKLNAQTVLQTRTEDTRQRLLAERIAEVIVDNADATCINVSVEDDLGEIKITSKVLKKLLEPGKKLWQGSAAKSRGEFYYVKNLEEFIVPVNSEGVKDNPDVGDKFKGSQNGEFVELVESFVDIENNPGDSTVKKEDKTMEKVEKALESSQKILERSQSILEAAEKSMETDCSLRLSKSWSEGSFNLNQQVSPDKIETKKEDKTPEDKKMIEETPKKRRKSKVIVNLLANSWRKMLNSRQCSDVIVLCGDNKFIYGHSVVLWTRCESLYRDLTEDDKSRTLESFDKMDQLKYRLNWTEIDYNTALMFLEFIYCGFIEDLSGEIDKLNLLVEKYNYDELSQYLENFKNKNNSKINVSVTINRSIKKVSNNLSLTSPINVQCNYSNVTMSPDIFDDMDSMTCDNFIDKIEEKVQDSTVDNDMPPAVDVNSVSNDVDVSNKSNGKEEKETVVIDDQNLKTILRRSSTCPDSLRDIGKISTPRSFSEDLNDTLKKTRSELSVFIEKIQRRNARDILDDSDDDSFLPEIKKGNKFKKVDESPRDRYKNVKIDTANINLRRGSRFWATKKSIEKPEKVEVKKSALSIFEDDIREKVALEPDKFKKLCDDFESDFEMDDKDVKDISNLTQSFDVDDPNVSMYTKYKLTHKDNSIAYYRDLIKDSKDSEDSNVDVQKGSVATEVDKDNSVVSPTVDSNVDKENQSRVDLEDDLVIELDDINVEQTILSQKSYLDIEFADDDFEDDDFNVDKIIDESFNPTKSAVDFIKDLESRSSSGVYDKVIDVDLDDYDDDKPIESFTANQNEDIVDQDDNIDSFTANQSQEINVSQDVDVISASQCTPSKVKNRRISRANQLFLQELSKYDLYKSKDQHNLDEESVLDLTLSDEEKEDKPCKRQRSVEDLSTVESSDEEMYSIKKKKNSIFLNLDSDEEEASQHINSQEKTITSNLTNILKECGVISQTPRSPSPICLSDDEVSPKESPVHLSFSPPDFEFSQFAFEGGADLPDNLITSTQVPSTYSSLDFRLRRSTTVSPVKNRNSRLLVNKSKSTDFSFRKSTNQPQEINKEEVCNYLKLSKENVVVSTNVEPKVDFNLLSSPELNKKLNSYGLKNQKRHRAVKLLTYIYESLNPLVPEEIVSRKSNFVPSVQEEYKWRIESLLRTDDEEINGNLEVPSNGNDQESVSSELPEEMDLTDDEYDQKDLKSVKEVFEMLLCEDDDLHRKVLMYESLPLEALHTKVKDRGVKCSVRVLMDYLNEECISFYVEAPKKWSNGRKKPKKK